MTAVQDQSPPPRVLVVDDDEGVRATLEILFADAGIEVLTARDVTQGLDMFAAHRVDLVITDMQMPVAGGGEMISAIHRRSPGIPVIAMSGNSTISETGADRMIKKPFDFDELSTLVQALLLGADGAGTAGKNGGDR